MPARLERLAQLLAWGAAVALTLAVAVTLGDILLRAVARVPALFGAERLGYGIIGVVDLVQLCIMTAAWLSIPWAFATGGHVSVDLFGDRLPEAARALFGALAAGAACVFLALTWRNCLDQALAVQAYGDRSATLQIPLVWYWLPLLFGLALSTLITGGQTVARACRFLRALGRG